MGRFSQYERNLPGGKTGPHPIWRGLGFLLIALIAVMSYAGANLLVDANKVHHWIAVPQELSRGVSWNPDLYQELVVAIFLAFIGFGILTIVYSIIYRASRPKDLFKMLK